MSSTRLQDLYAQALARRVAAPGSCVGAEDIMALVRREGPEARRLEVLDHVMGCSECHREFSLIQALEAAGPRTGSERVTHLRRRFMPLALAASVLIAVGLGVAVRQRFGAGDPLRGGGATTLVLLSPPPAVSPGQPITFSWKPVPGVERYRVEVLDSSGAQVISQFTPDSSLTVSRGQLRAGTTYRWWVRDAAPGARLASPLRSLRIRSE